MLPSTATTMLAPRAAFALGFLSTTTTLVSSAPLLHRDGAPDFDSCVSSAGLSADALFPSSDGFQSAAAAYNQRLTWTPASIISPTTPDEVGKIVSCAAQAGLAVQARGGGHSYAAYGLGGEDGAVIIDLHEFNSIDVEDDGTAKVGGGNRLGDIYLALNDKGRGVPAGVCPYVGVGGHASFGGFGLAGRWQGLLVDRVQSLDVVLANGTVASGVTKSSYPDLFWALQGAAPSYGIITSFTFSTFSVPSTVINYNIKLSLPSASVATSAFSAWQNYTLSSDVPAELGISFTFGGPSSTSATISGVFYGSKDDFNAVIQPLKSALPSETNADFGDVQPYSWIDSQAKLAGGQQLQTMEGKDNRDTFYAKSLVTPEDKPLTDQALKSFFDFIYDKGQKADDTAWFVEVNLYGGANSAINKVGADETAFAHRSSLLTFQLYASSSNYSPPYPSDGIPLIQGMVDAITSDPSMEGADFGGYTNYVDPELSESEWKQLYWGGESGDRYKRLLSIKKDIDPRNTFRNPQSIA